MLVQSVHATDASERISCPLCSRNLHLESGALFPCPCIWQSLFRRLGVAYVGRCLFRGWCLRPVTRWQLLCCAPRLSGLPLHGLALAPALQHRCPNVLLVHRVAVPASLLACVDRLLLRSRDWLRAWPLRVCPPVPPPQLRLSRVSGALHAASVGSQPSVDASGPSAPSAPVSEAPRVTESASNSDDEWDALLDAHGLAPSLGGAAAAVAQPAEAAGASRRARDKRRRRQRKAAKRLHVEGHLICSLCCSARYCLARHRSSWVRSGHVYTFEGHVEVLVVAVLSCGS